MTTCRRSIVEALLDREVCQSTADASSSALAYPQSSPSRYNAIWRQKVIQWYFTVVAALRRQHVASSASTTGSSSSNADFNPFDRSMVHVSASLLDGYLASLSGERAMRFRRDCSAYQLLATTCLLMGMRLAQHESIKEGHELRRRAEDSEEGGGGGGELKRAKTHRTNMNDAAPEETAAATATRVVIPTASTILRISAAPKSITERHVLSMVNELTGSRSFPRSGKVVTALDYIRALSSSHSARLEEEDVPVFLGPDDAEEARRLADIALVDPTFIPRRPAVLACAVITLALSKSHASSDIVRRSVRRSVLGRFVDDDDLVRAVHVAESDLRALRSAPTSRDVRRAIIVVPPPPSHLIPLEDD